MTDYYSNITTNPERALAELNNLRRKLEENHDMKRIMDGEHQNYHSGLRNYE
jgi:hypothetical protein